MWMWAAEKIQGSEQLHHKRLPTRAAPRDPSRHRPPRNDGHCEAVVFQRDMHLLKLYKATRKDLNADRCSRDAHMVIIVSFSISKLSWYLTQIPAAIGHDGHDMSWYVMMVMGVMGVMDHILLIFGDGSKPYPPVVHIKIAGIYGCSSP
jgi:hypothetical protein